MAQKIWMILILKLIIDLDFTAIAYGNRIVKAIALAILVVFIMWALVFILREF